MASTANATTFNKFNLENWAYKSAEKTVNAITTNLDENQRTCLLRRHTYNNLATYSFGSAVAAIASVVLAVLTRLNPVFLLLAGAAYVVHYQANKHINASPVIRDQTALPSNYFDTNNPLRTKNLREYMGLAQPAASQTPSAPSSNAGSAQQKEWEPEFWGFKNYISFKRQISTDLATIDHANPDLISVRETEARRPNNETANA